MIQGKPMTPALLEELLPSPGLRRWLGVVYEHFAEVLRRGLSELTLYQDTRMSDQELVSGGTHQGAVFLGVGGSSRMEPDPSICDGPWRPASIILSPGELCGEYEAGVSGVKPTVFRWTIYSYDRTAGIVRISPTLVQRLFGDYAIRNAVLHQQLTWRDEDVFRGRLPRPHRDRAVVANWMLRKSIGVRGERAKNGSQVIVSKNRTASALGMDPRTLGRILEDLHARDVVELFERQENDFEPTRCRVRSFRALRQIALSGCDYRYHETIPPDGRYKRRSDLAHY